MNKIDDICIIGAGQGGISLIKAIRARTPQVKITLIDKNNISFDKKYLYSLLLNKDKEKIIHLEDFAKEFAVNFIRKEVERINFNKRVVYFKDKQTLTFSNLVIATGLMSKPLEVKGVNREGFFYLAELDLYQLRNLLKISYDIVVFASGVSGLQLTLCLSKLDKEIKLFTRSLHSLGEAHDAIRAYLAQAKIDVYESGTLLEVIGDSTVKAARVSFAHSQDSPQGSEVNQNISQDSSDKEHCLTDASSLPQGQLRPDKVYSAQIVLADSGFRPNRRLLDFSPDPDSFMTPYPQVYLLGDMRNDLGDEGRFFIFNSEDVREEAVLLAEQILEGKELTFQRRQYNNHHMNEFLKNMCKQFQPLSQDSVPKI